VTLKSLSSGMWQSGRSLLALNVLPTSSVPSPCSLFAGVTLWPTQKIVLFFQLIGVEVLTAVIMKSSIFWDIIPHSLLKVNQHVRETFYPCFAACFMLVSCLAYSSTLEMEATCSYEMLIDFQLTTQCYVLEDTTIFSLYRLFLYLVALIKCTGFIVLNERMIVIYVLGKMQKEDIMTSFKVQFWYFLTSWVTLSCAESTLLHGVS
jgi:hypothetical protein